MAAPGLKANISNIHILFTCLLVALIPFSKVLISYVIFLWLVTAIILMFRHKEKVSGFRFNTGLLLSILLYLVFVIGVIYSHNTAAAVFDIQVKMTLILLPPVIYLLRSFYRKYNNIILAVFVIANIVAALICLAAALNNSIQWINGAFVFNIHVPGNYPDINTGLPSYFTYDNLSIFRHPAYFSMYLLLCVFILVYFLWNSYMILKSRMKSRIIYIIVIAFFVLMIYLLQSKAAYLSLLLLAFVTTIAYTMSRRKWLIGFFLIAIVAALSIYGYKQNTRFFYINAALKDHSGLTEAIHKRDYKVLIDTYSMDRLVIWMLSAGIIKDHFFIGVGSGDVRESLLQRYKDQKLQALEMYHYNTHNQYLETFMAVGIIGFLVFISWLFYPLFKRRHYGKSDFLILVFSGILILNFIFEAALNTIAGVVFAAFFYSFLLYVPARGADDIVMGDMNKLAE
jgi:O-antigen ligase